MIGYLHSFESLAAVDGEGLRYGVFMQGCPLRCVYCHNPDTWPFDGGMPFTAEALVDKIKRYKPYFGANGGVTFSGGEPLCQADFLCEVLPRLAFASIRYVIDTSGAVPLTASVKTVLRGAQEVLLDLKFPDDSGYLTYVGRDGTATRETLAFLQEANVPTVIRIVIVPGLNDTEEALARYLAVLAPYTVIRRIDLLPFHTMGFFKYESLGLVNRLADKEPPDAETMSRLRAYLDAARA